MESRGIRLVDLRRSANEYTCVSNGKELTADPVGYRTTRQETDDICCKVITVEFDKMVCFGTVHFLQREYILVECILINLCRPTVDDLDWLAMVGLTRFRLENTLTKEYFSSVYDDRSVPMS